MTNAMWLIIAALVLMALAVALWVMDSKRRQAPKEMLADVPPTPAQPTFVADQDRDEQWEEEPVDPNHVDQPVAEYDDAEPLDVEVEEELVRVPVVDADEHREELPEEIVEEQPQEVEEELAHEQEEAREEEVESVEPASFVEESADEESTSEQSTEEAPASEANAEPERSLWVSSLPGAARRERKHWAQAHGFDYAKNDDFLTDEWSRGAASSGALAREVVSGVVQGYEMHLIDLDGIPVMAMRRGSSSDVVVDARRSSASSIAENDDSDDLLTVLRTGDFELLSNDVGVAERFFDERVEAALAGMPEQVTAVWAESDWVLAQTERRTSSRVWDGMIDSLMLLADAARVLPPRTGAMRQLDLTGIDPTRPMPEEPEVEVPEDPQEEELHTPIVQRPEEPVELPSRAVPEARGVVEPSALGSDEVAAIGESMTNPDPKDLHGSRIVRGSAKGSSIFDDLASDFGLDPLNDDSLPK